MALERWTSGDAYDRYIGRWSAPVAAEFVAWLAVPEHRRWVDVGCGTGALTAEILAGADPAAVTGVDQSAAYVEWAAARHRDPRVRFVVGDATEPEAAEADVVVSGLMLNFLPDPAAALAAMRATAGATDPGGVVAAYVWDYAAGMELLRTFWDAAIALDPAAAALDEGARFPLCQPDRLAALWRAAGLADVATHAIDVPAVLRDFDDYWTPFLGGQGPAPQYVASLTDVHRAQLRERLRARLPAGPDGAITLTVRAWAVRGRTP